jgi:hypothetical protein
MSAEKKKENQEKKLQKVLKDICLKQRPDSDLISEDIGKTNDRPDIFPYQTNADIYVDMNDWICFFCLCGRDSGHESGDE